MNAKRKIPALGRYPEDQYDGYGLSLANPWFICTLAASEVVYKASSYLNALNEPLIITKNGWKWYNRFLPVGEGAKIAPGSREMGKIVEGMKDLGDGWLRIVQEHVGKNGSMHEQYDRFVSFFLFFRFPWSLFIDFDRNWRFQSYWSWKRCKRFDMELCGVHHCR